MASGLPSLLSGVAALTNKYSLISADAVRVLQLFSNSTQWGIYNNGTLAISPDSIQSLNFKNEYKISDYPQELGAFESYNKVKTPYSIKIRMSKAGTDVQRKQFLTDVENATGSLALFDTIMPERTYSNGNIISYEFVRQTTGGIGILIIDLNIEEVRTNTTTSYTYTALASGKDPSSTGAVQTQTPTSSQTPTGTIQ